MRAYGHVTTSFCHSLPSPTRDKSRFHSKMPSATILPPNSKLDKSDIFDVVKIFRVGTKAEHRFDPDAPVSTLSKEEIFAKLSEIGVNKVVTDDILVILGKDDWDQPALVDLAMAVISCACKKVETGPEVETAVNKKRKKTESGSEVI